MKKRAYRKSTLIILPIFMTLTLLLTLGFAYPRAFLVIINIVWLILLILVLVFVAIGFLTVIGLKVEAGRIIDLFLEGSLTIIDAMQFVKKLIEEFIKTLKEAAILLIPYVSYLVAGILYLLILTFYKWIGRSYDVTFPTIFLAFLLTTIAGILHLHVPDGREESNEWLREVRTKFRRHFVDGFEIALFILFLTIDSTNLFFLPKELNISLEAKLGNYDLMTRSFAFADQFRVTLTLIILGITIEVVRNIIRLVVVAVNYYKNPLRYLDITFNTTAERIKWALRKAVSDAKDDILVFTAFTTLLMLVFLLFPRLKLLALVTASATSLFLDLAIPRRLVITERDDLLARALDRIFKIR